MPALSSHSLVSRTALLVGSSTASRRRRTHIGRITSGYFPPLNRSRSMSSAMFQMKETILLCVAWSISVVLSGHDFAGDVAFAGLGIAAVFAWRPELHLQYKSSPFHSFPSQTPSESRYMILNPTIVL